MLIDRSNDSGYPGAEWRPGTFASPESQTLSLESSPNASMVQWYQAYRNPSYSRNGRSAAGQEEYLRDLQSGPNWVIVNGNQHALKRYFPEGSWTAGDIAVMYDESKMELSIFDYVVPYGAGTSGPGAIDAPTFTAKEVVIRAATTVALAGTISSVGESVTGIGTAFTSQLKVGDVISVAGSAYVVGAIANDTHLTITTNPPINWQNMAYLRAFDRVMMPPIARVLQVRDASMVYPSTSYAVAADMGGIDWVNAAEQPASGGQYSMSYRYFPTYMVTDYGQKGRVVKGRPELSVALCKLLRPDTSSR